MAYSHCQQVMDPHSGEVRAGIRRGIVGKEREHRVVHRQPSLGHGQAHGGRGKALGQGKELVGMLGSIGRPPALGDSVAVAL